MTKLNWDKAGKTGKSTSVVGVREVKVDDDFWRCWKHESAAMKASGYRLQKTKDGWKAFIEIKG